MVLQTAYLVVTLFGGAAFGKLYRSPTPPMGWNSYNYYGCIPTEDIIKANADGLVDQGLAGLGFTVVTTDCGWPSRDRDAEGRLQWNVTLFPSGPKALGDYLHSKGLKFGLYSGAGVWQCDQQNGATRLPASLGNETIDAETFSSWGGDALKYDNCWANITEGFVVYNPYEPDPSVRFAKMAGELDRTDRNIEYAICQWGVGTDLGYWAPRYGNSWRISQDIYDDWRSIWRIGNQVVHYSKHTGVGKYADMDMLIIGLRNLNEEEEKFHFSLWAIEKSLLVIGSSLEPGKLRESSANILRNEEIIAINQDPLAEQARLLRRYTEESYDVWGGNLTDGGYVIAVTNWSNDTQTVSLNLLDEVGILQVENVRDVWAATDLGARNGGDALELDLKGHEAKVLVLRGARLATSPQKGNGSKYYSAADASLSGTAFVEECTAKPDDCLPTRKKVKNLDRESAITFSGIEVPPNARTASKVVGIDYINFDIAHSTAWNFGTNTRNMSVAVNGGLAHRWALPLAGADWYETGRLDVVLDGFKEGIENDVVITTTGGVTNWGPDLVGLEVYN